MKHEPITIKQFFENQIINKQAYPELVRYKKYQLAVRDHCLRICKSRNIKVNKLQTSESKSVYLFPIEIIKEAVSKETEVKKPRGRNAKTEL